MAEINIELNRFNGTSNDALLLRNSLTGSTDPSTATKGFVGQSYVNTATSDIFKCKSASVGNYAWVRLCPDEIGTELANVLGLTSTAKIVDGMMALRMPVGAILLWSGSTTNIPAGWILCDGNNGTPNLKDRFVVGAGGMYNVGDNGGLSSVALTIEEIPSHNHEIATSGSYGTNNVIQVANIRDGGKYNTNYNGGSQSHENRPPYYALCYIMYKGG